MKICNFCFKEVNKFLPYKNGLKDVSEFCKNIDPIGSDVENFLCPHCNSTDRDRHLKMYLELTGALNQLPNPRILHFAPEKHLVSYLSIFNPEIHIFADLYKENTFFESIDIEEIPYSDCSFDLVIANHILEHVSNPEKALSELNRVIKNKGVVIIQTPYSSFLSSTFEDSSICTPDTRHYFYGQDDHVRWFGKDIFDLYSTYLKSEVKYHNELFTNDSNNIHGVNIREPFFYYQKKELVPPNITTPVHLGNLRNPGKPLVSILCITFNQEKFISDALNNFLNQKTDFTFEIVIGDDCSTDNTSTILESYRAKHPDIIKIIRPSQNIGSSQNFLSALSHCTGEFIALCEGDDYWCDPHKLQKQADYLNQDINCAITFANVQAIQDGKIDYGYTGGSRRDLTQAELLCAHPINTLTVMFRKEALHHIPPEVQTCGAGDMFLWSIIGARGNGKYLNSILPSVYRKHVDGMHSLKSESEKKILHLMTHYSLFLYYTRIGQINLSQYFLSSCKGTIELIKKLSTSDQHYELLTSMHQRMSTKAKGLFDFDDRTLLSLISDFA
jgi:glycosyltransferase involved in cell wall biosynthesis/SAM-dependent methyltransferase